ncbi:HAD family hydrolase [Variovorax paradoxus]|uniref:HAD family hydrolase n=1 Tax=Variovorax paradoxus TaxID=34073 RepID=UPI00041D157E
MAISDLRQTVVVFDLDDTLYPELDYVRSGIRHVGTWLEKLCGADLQAQIAEAIVHPKEDWIGLLCAAANFPLTAKESLLWMYRLHAPEISLTAECKQMLDRLEHRCMRVLVLTDGRGVTQRIKLQALGLSRFRAYVSEDYQSEKPDALRFRAIEQDYPAESYFYVGDNPRKDFIACNALGWTGVGLRGKGAIHSQDLSNVLPDALPNYWIDEWHELLELLC